MMAAGGPATGPALSGACLCGACSFTATPATYAAAVCHCGMCRKWTGGMFISVPCGDVTFAEGAPVNGYRSSGWAERLSCATCGSSILYRSDAGDEAYVSVQMFDDPGQFPVRSEIFIDDKPAGYALADVPCQMIGAEIMAMYAPREEA